MKTRIESTAMFVVLCLFSAGCAPQSEIVKLYEKQSGEQKVYRRLLVVDISSERNRQQLFEDEIVRQLQSEQVEAIASHTKLSYSDGIPRDAVDALGKDVGADGILLTQITSVDTEIDVEKGREEIMSTCRRGDPVDYFLYDHKVLKEPDAIKLAHTVVVVTNLYDVATQERVWSIQSTCFKTSSLSDGLASEATAIVGQLRIDDLI